MDGEKIQKREPGGKLEGQKFKSLLVMQYILKNADDETPVSLRDIQSRLENYGIYAERCSIQLKKTRRLRM